MVKGAGGNGKKTNSSCISFPLSSLCVHTQWQSDKLSIWPMVDEQACKVNGGNTVHNLELRKATCKTAQLCCNTLMTMLASRGGGFADNKMNLMITSPLDNGLRYQLRSLTNFCYFCVFTQFGNFCRGGPCLRVVEITFRGVNVKVVPIVESTT